MAQRYEAVDQAGVYERGLSASATVSRRYRPVGELGADQRRGRAARQVVEVTHQVAVVGVPARRGHVAHARRAVRSQELHRAVEPKDPPGRLGSEPDLLAEPGDEVTPTPADLLRQHAHRDVAVSGDDLTPRPAHRRFHLGTLHRPPKRPLRHCRVFARPRRARFVSSTTCPTDRPSPPSRLPAPTRHR